MTASSALGSSGVCMCDCVYMCVCTYTPILNTTHIQSRTHIHTHRYTRPTNTSPGGWVLTWYWWCGSRTLCVTLCERECWWDAPCGRRCLSSSAGARPYGSVALRLWRDGCCCTCCSCGSGGATATLLSTCRAGLGARGGASCCCTCFCATAGGGSGGAAPLTGGCGG